MNLLDKLIKQGKDPEGFIGKIMLHIMNIVHNGLMKWGLENVKINEDDLILDIGCGGGKAIRKMSTSIKGGKIYGVDYSKTAVNNSIKNNRKDIKEDKVEIKKAGVSSMPFSNDFFDLATAFQTHYFWPDLEKDIKEVYRVLKPNGSFIIVSELYKINYHMKSYKTKEELEQLFKLAGYNSVHYHENKKWMYIIGTKKEI